MKILLTGYYGAGNFGDDIMLEAFCKEIKKANSEVEIHIFKLFDKDLEIDLDKDVKIINYYKVKRLRRFIFKLLVKKYDMMLWGGGTCFTDQDGDGLYPYMRLAKECGVKIGYIGIGIGKLTVENQIEKMNYLLNNSDIVTLRDKTSYEYALSKVEDNSKVFLTEDLAYLFVKNIIFDRKEKKKDTDNRKIIISWRNLEIFKPKEEELKLIENLVEFIKLLAMENINTEFIFLPLDDRRDLEINKLIYDKVKNMECDKVKFTYKENLTPIEKINCILDSDINVSARLHGIFVSEIANIKTVGMSYSIKIDEFLDSIEKSQDFIDISDITAEKLQKIYNLENKFVDNSMIEDKIINSKNNIKKLNEVIIKSNKKQ